MESQNDRHGQVECTVCFRMMRSDHLKRHMRKHRDLYSLDENGMREEIKERKRKYEDREERKRLVLEIVQQENAPLECIEVQSSPTKTPLDIETLEEELLQDNQDYLENIELGKQINTIIDKGVVREESLSKHRKDALDLYRKQKPTRDMLQVELRHWQQELMDIIATPTEREVIWVQGIKGNEGKSWFQDYLTSFYGHARVVRLDLKMKTANVLHVLTKRPLSSTNIFLFNEPRAINNEICNYSILESIKDGIAVASKYNGDFIQFKVPNVVVAFSNTQPKMKQLSRDRWRVLRITKNGLNDITDRLWKIQKEAKRPCTYMKEDDIQEDWS